MKLNKDSIGKKCPCCFRYIDERTVNTFKQMKAEKKSTRLKALGIDGAGRPRLRDDEQIHILRSKGLSLEDISVTTGLSVATILRGLHGQ